MNHPDIREALESVVKSLEEAEANVSEGTPAMWRRVRKSIKQAQAALAACEQPVFDQMTFVGRGGYLPVDLFVENTNEGDRIHLIGYRVE